MKKTKRPKFRVGDVLLWQGSDDDYAIVRRPGKLNKHGGFSYVVSWVGNGLVYSDVATESYFKICKESADSHIKLMDRIVRRTKV